MKSTPFYVIMTTILLAASCTQPPEYPDEPIIEYKNVNKNTIYQGSRTGRLDTLVITFSFTDGDGNLGDTARVDGPNVLLIDSRDSTITLPYKIKPIPEQGSNNGISGEMTAIVSNTSKSIISGKDTFKLGNICCIIPDVEICSTDPLYPRDTFSYLIRVRDKAGNWSNTIRTETITILCQ